MITRQTVFVLGAGCSMPYDFPSSEELVKEIAGLVLGKPTPDVFNDADLKNEDVQRFGRDLLESDASSIDTFLQYRPEFLKIGKLAIAMRLSGRELDGKLNFPFRGGSQSSPGLSPWYHYLWDQMVTEKGRFGDNRVAFVTFNYDRSLERYLFLRLKALHGYRIADEVFDDLYKIQFIHIHGSLGDERFAEFPYDRGKHSNGELIKISSRLRIIHEDPAGNPHFAAANDLLQNAERICFLGYGFHDVNNNGLKLRTLAADDKRRDQQWFTSRFHMTEVEFRRRANGLLDRFLSRGYLKGRVGEESDSALDVLRKLPVI